MLVPLVFYLLKRVDNSLVIKPRFNLVELSVVKVLFQLSIPVYLYQLLLFTNLDELNFIVPHYDFAFYAQLADSFNNFGHENKGLFENILFKEEFAGVAPYHYPEIWFSAILTKCFSIDSLNALLFLAFPALKIGVLAGIFSLFNWKTASNIQKLNYQLLLFLAPAFFTFFLQSEYTKYYLGFAQSGVFSYFGNKYLPIYLTAILGMKLWMSGRKEASLLVMLLSAVFSIGTAPAIIASVFISFLFFKGRIKALFPVVLFSICLLLFYKAFSVSNVGTYLKKTILIQKIIDQPYLITHYRTFLFAFIFPYLRLFIYYLPYIFLLLINTKKFSLYKPNADVLFVGMITFVGAISAALLTGMLDATQLLYNTLPIATIFFIVHLSRIKSQLLLLIILVVCTTSNMYNNFMNKESNGFAYNHYDANFRKTVLAKVDSIPRSYEVIAYSLSEKNYQLGVNASRYLTPCFFMNLAKTPAYYIDINTFRFDQYFSCSDFINAKNEIKNYKNRLGLNGSSDSHIQYRFLKEFKVHYLVLQEGTKISPRLIESLPIVTSQHDGLTHDVLYELKW